MSTRDHQIEQFLSTDSFDDDIINQIVENKLNITSGSYKVKLVLVSPATKPNDNYLGLVLRVKIKIEIKETKKIENVDVVAKFSLDTLDSADFNVYIREKLMYENILKSFEETWLERAGEKVKFAPKSLAFSDGASQLIVLEDLKQENYTMMDRKEALSLELTKAFLPLLAKYHAAGAVSFKKVRYS